MSTEAASAASTITEAGAAIGGLPTVHAILVAVVALIIIGLVVFLLVCFGFARFGWDGIIPLVKANLQSIGADVRETLQVQKEAKARQDEHAERLIKLLEAQRAEFDRRLDFEAETRRREIETLRIEVAELRGRTIDPGPPTSRSPAAPPAPQSTRPA